MTPSRSVALRAEFLAIINAALIGTTTHAAPAFTHDPSTIVKCNDQYWVFATGRGIVSWHSKDRLHWQRGPEVLTRRPDWTTNAVPGSRGYFWAPDLLSNHGQYYLYYSVSTWGRNTSAIGLATSPTLDPADPKFGWTDRGLVVASKRENEYNAIDPGVMKDRDGTLWLVFGSYWSGIKLIQLDPATGRRITPDSPIYSLAHHDSIEAASIYRHGDYYYLFLNWGQCCRGTNSTYNIRIGRSPNIMGPYLDKQGVDLSRNGGTLLLGNEGDRIGPGHPAVYSENGTNWMSYHFYDGRNRGTATLGIRQIKWNEAGWPELQ